MRDAIADRLPTRAFGCSEPAEHRSAIVIHQHGLGYEAPARQQCRAVTPQQFHHQVLADPLTAEWKDVDGPANRPHHLIVKKARKRVYVANRQGTVNASTTARGTERLIESSLRQSSPVVLKFPYPSGR